MKPAKKQFKSKHQFKHKKKKGIEIDRVTKQFNRRAIHNAVGFSYSEIELRNDKMIDLSGFLTQFRRPRISTTAHLRNPVTNLLIPAKSGTIFTLWKSFAHLVVIESAINFDCSSPFVCSTTRNKHLIECRWVGTSWSIEHVTSKAKKPPDLSAEAAPWHRWRRWSMPSAPPSKASSGSCKPTSACKPGIFPLGMYGGLLTRPVSLPSTSRRGSNQEPCLNSILSCMKRKHAASSVKILRQATAKYKINNYFLFRLHMFQAQMQEVGEGGRRRRMTKSWIDKNLKWHKFPAKRPNSSW